MEKKMTNRDYLNLVASGNINEDVKAWALGEIAKLDNKNAKRKDTETKTQRENKVLMAQVVETIGEGSMVASDIAKALGVSTQKASALCVLLVKEGTLSVADLKVKNKGTVKCYSVVGE